MLTIYEQHRVKGSLLDDFERTVREEWMPALADDATRLLWYYNLAHGTGISFNVVTVTAVQSWEAWEKLAWRVFEGDLRTTARKLDGFRYSVSSRLLEALPWSPLQSIDLGLVGSSDGTEHGLQLYVCDVVHPKTDTPKTAIDALSEAYPQGDGLTTLVAAWSIVLGGGRRGEVILLQKVTDLDALAHYYLTGEGPAQGGPWSFRHGQVPFYDDWTTSILRTSTWSPFN